MWRTRHSSDAGDAATLSGATTTYGFAQAATSAAVPSGVGATRTTQALSGNFGGLMYTTAQNTPYVVTGGTLISTDAPNNRVQATLNGTRLAFPEGRAVVVTRSGFKRVRTAG